MIHTDRAIVVEGKYDKIKLSSMVDGVIICTGGFRVYKDKEMQAMLRALAKKQGLAVLTDSDTAGFKIRGFLRSICGKENIVDVYVPDLYGKEKRKDHPSKEGKLGVEGVPEEVLQKAFADAGIGGRACFAKERPYYQDGSVRAGTQRQSRKCSAQKAADEALNTAGTPDNQCSGDSTGCVDEPGRTIFNLWGSF